jgi:hypothetical protein
MSNTFKVKTKKADKRKNQVLETLDSKHQDMIRHIESLQDTLPGLQSLLKHHQDKLADYKRQIDVLHEIPTSSSLASESKSISSEEAELNLDMDNKLYVAMYHEEEIIQKLQRDITKIQNNEHINEYFLKTGHLLYDYYDGQKPRGGDEAEAEADKSEAAATATAEEQEGAATAEEPEGAAKETEKAKKKNSSIGTVLKKTKITDFIDKDNGFEKADMYNRYIQLINNHTFIQKEVSKQFSGGGAAVCPKCMVDLTLFYSEGLQVCNMCGLTEYILIDSEKPSFREPPPEVSYFAYKRINHFNEWLSQFQAKESTEIPPEIYQAILLEMKKERITDLNKITHAKIREYLKKLKLNKYYEHIPHILNKLNKKVPLIGKEVEDKLRHMFKEIQAPFMKICPPTRKNFLSYSYVLHKFVELLNLDHLKDAFHLLKSREKLHQQDQMWKEICRELNWMYIKSI